MISNSVFLCLTAFVFYAGASVQAFECPEPFGVYADPDDDQHYYVCENKLPLRGDCKNSMFVPEVCNKTSSVNSTCTTKSGNFRKENGTSSLNDTLVDYEDFEELNCTVGHNETSATNTSSFNETDTYYCNETLSIVMDPANSKYIIKCGANFTNENETNFNNDTSMDYDNYQDLFNITFEGNDTYKIEVFGHNVTYLNESESFHSNETHDDIIFLHSGHLANETKHAEKNATSKKTNQTHKKGAQKKTRDNSATTTPEPWMGTTIMASGSRRSNNSNYECPPVDGFYPDITDKRCHAYWECRNNKPHHHTCSGIKVFDPETTNCEAHEGCSN